ncbi:hypothetical protein [Streptomyces sp. NPDC053560]|uniref:hypothetical protein n=1 Tax=Streptomyces sp. NPDC053560 TaxID=3365711 RepID=UPI0037D44664
MGHRRAAYLRWAAAGLATAALLTMATWVWSAYSLGGLKNGDQRDQDSLATLNIEPANTTSPMRIATAGLRSFFPGGIGKVAVYSYELSGDRIAAHYSVMTS